MAKSRPKGGRPPGRRGRGGIGPGPGYKPGGTGKGTSHKPTVGCGVIALAFLAVPVGLMALVGTYLGHVL